MKREFKTGTFDLRGLVDEHKQNLLNQDLNNYRVRVVVYNKWRQTKQPWYKPCKLKIDNLTVNLGYVVSSSPRSGKIILIKFGKS